MVRAQSRLPSLQLDPKRIAANSLVIALHAAAFGLLLMPVALPPPETVEEQTVLVEFTTPKPPAPIPVPIQREPRAPVRQPQTITPPVPIPTTPTTTDFIDPQGSEIAEVLAPTGDIISTGETGPALAQLALIAGPAPAYPGPAVRARLQGEVLLRVLVDAQGLPESVVVERSSGHRLLDQAAMRQVKGKWRFQPMLLNGHAAAAYALVPIRFNLAE